MNADAGTICTVRLGGIDHPQIGRRLFSATTGAISVLKVALSGSDTQGLNATIAMKIALVVAENKRRPIWGWSIPPKRTVVMVM